MNQHISAKKDYHLGAILIVAVLAFCLQHCATAQAQAGPDQAFVVEYYYKARWGHGEEFIRLFKKNHYPVLKKEMEAGRILRVTAATPRYHATEDGRWDYRVTIVWKNVSVTNDNYDPQPVIRQLFPDQDTFQREEQRRFEILAAHWDLPIRDLNLEK